MNVLRGAVAAILIFAFQVGVLLLHVFAFHPGVNFPLLFTLPVLLAAWIFRPGTTLIFVAVALAEIGYHSWLESIPPWAWGADSVTVIIIAVLGIWLAEQSRAQTRLARENARLAEERSREAARMRVLVEAAQLFGSSLDLEKTLQSVVERTTEELGDLGLLFLLNGTGEVLRLQALRVSDPELRRTVSDILQKQSLAVGVGVAGAVAATGTSMLIGDVRQVELPPHTRFLLDAFHIISYIAVPFRVRGRVVGVLSIGICVGERRLAQEDLHLAEDLANLAATSIENARLYAEQERLVRELEESRHQREQFLGMVTHEIRGVLTVLSGYTQLIARPEGRHPDTVERMAVAVPPQMQRLSRLVNDLQDMSRIERGGFEIHRGRCDLAELARSVVEEQQSGTSRHRILLESQVDGLPGLWDCDRLAQVLTNLVRNAINYSPGGGEVKVVVDRMDGTARVSVSDQGVGIAAEDIPRLFKPYSRLERTADVKGTGLGLFITKAIVEAHGGSIGVQSEPERGSTFTIILPLDQSDNGR